MKKRQILFIIEDTKKLIKESPELFHDGIDDDIISVLDLIKKYIDKD